MARKRGKYGNVKTMVDGVRFDSKKEASEYVLLKARLQKGEIRDLKLQTSYPLIVNGVKVGSYRSDFDFVECATGEAVTLDVKGVRTAVYKLKKKLVFALYGITIKEV